ncbi:MAG: methyltransferase domain-containing protein [Pseudomonadota bacterium]
MTDGRKKFLDNVYDLESADATRDFYDRWSETYDSEVSENGYVTPKRLAEALAEYVPDHQTPVLDLGCGTGVSGQALRDQGFPTLDGSDFSPRMLEQARAKGIYRNLLVADLNTPMPFASGAYQVITAVGVLNPGHGPAEVLDSVLEKLPKGGIFAFSLNDHALADPSYEARLMDHLDCGTAALLFKEYGPHLPAIDLKSNVYVLQKS